jgi:hypothetical protein
MMETTQTELSGLYAGLKFDEQHIDADLVQRAINDIANLRKERDKLKTLCSELYQVVGALWEGGDEQLCPVLDNLSDAASGYDLRHDTLLPFTPHKKD